MPHCSREHLVLLNVIKELYMKLSFKLNLLSIFLCFELIVDESRHTHTQKASAAQNELHNPLQPIKNL